jgi:hypothetical protein
LRCLSAGAHPKQGASGSSLTTPLCCRFPSLSHQTAVQRNVPTHITWTNDLKDAAGNFLPHILRDSIDQTIHWANPAVSHLLASAVLTEC